MIWVLPIFVLYFGVGKFKAKFKLTISLLHWTQSQGDRSDQVLEACQLEAADTLICLV